MAGVDVIFLRSHDSHWAARLVPDRFTISRKNIYYLTALAWFCSTLSIGGRGIMFLAVFHDASSLLCFPSNITYPSASHKGNWFNRLVRAQPPPSPPIAPSTANIDMTIHLPIALLQSPGAQPYESLQDPLRPGELKACEHAMWRRRF